MFFNKFTAKNAFTLAELLITLSIVGVIAILALKTLNTHYEKKETVIKLQKVYEDLNKAIDNGIIENGPVYEWNFETAPTDFFNTYLTTLRVDKTEKLPTDKKTKPTYYKPDGKKSTSPFNYSSTTQVLYLPQGAQIFIRNNGYAHGHITIDIDLNGYQNKPNILGKDFFRMILYTDGILRFWVTGTKDNDYNATREDIKTKCTSINGLGCGALIQKDGWKIKDDYPW